MSTGQELTLKRALFCVNLGRSLGGFGSFMDLFEVTKKKPEEKRDFIPLADRMRPERLEDFVGQERLLAPGRFLRSLIEKDQLQSLIFWGPPGTGKTTLASIIAHCTQSHFLAFSAVLSGVKEIRQVIQEAEEQKYRGRRTILFVDEIHRFNKAQQDAFLPHVERGTIVLIGATTENPSFEVNSALLSRCKVLTLRELTGDEIGRILARALEDEERGLGKLQAEVTPEALRHLSEMAHGDARVALNALEAAVLTTAPGAGGQRFISLPIAEEAMQRKALLYDKEGEEHYNVISALHKSMRGSDPDAAVYWLARMLAGGEDVRFIARRIAVCAAEDVGNADPIATILAAAAVQISEFVGLPEAQLALAQAAIYVACAPQSNASSSAIWTAVGDVQNEKTVAVPRHLKDSHYQAAKKMGFGAEYKYPHNFEGGFVVQEYLPGGMRKKYYKPTERGYEKNIRGYLQKLEILIKDSKAKKD